MSPSCSSKQSIAGSFQFNGDEKTQAGVLATVDYKNQTTEPEFETAIEKWLAKQSLPIEAAVTTILGAFRGAVMGFVVDAYFEGACQATSVLSPSRGGGIDPKYLSLSGGYRPLLQSFIEGGTLEQSRNFAVMMGVNAGISRVMKKLRGKEDVYTNMVSGFGSGVMLSLVTGMRGPSVISVGVVFTLVNGGIIKVEETLSQQRRRAKNVLQS